MTDQPDEPGRPNPEFDRLRGETLAELDAADRAAGIDPGLPPPLPPPAGAAPLGSGGRRTLVRDPQSRYFAGVASGLAYYLNIDVTMVRVGFVGVLVLSGFLPAIIMYEVAAFLIPESGQLAAGRWSANGRPGRAAALADALPSPERLPSSSLASLASGGSGPSPAARFCFRSWSRLGFCGPRSGS